MTLFRIRMVNTTVLRRYDRKSETVTDSAETIERSR